MDASAWTVILTALTAGAAIAYTAITYFLLREAQRQTEGQISPVLAVEFNGVGGHTVSIENLGKGVALKGTLTVTLEEDPQNKTLFFKPDGIPGEITEALPLMKPVETYAVDLRQIPLLGGYTGVEASFNAFRFHFRLQYQSTSGAKYRTTAYAEAGHLIQDRGSYERVR